ncbi:hypothetical protein [Hydrogenophaga sp.]|uniref:hypothetical protein n=1 Tax=Hydrogenophaga sp. TaxID=1904254 RepID=UPI0039FBCF1F
MLEAPFVFVEGVGADMYVAIDRAADRVGRLVVKHLDRSHPVRNTERHAGQPARDDSGTLDFARSREDIA